MKCDENSPGRERKQRWSRRNRNKNGYETRDSALRFVARPDKGLRHCILREDSSCTFCFLGSAKLSLANKETSSRTDPISILPRYYIILARKYARNCAFTEIPVAISAQRNVHFLRDISFIFLLLCTFVILIAPHSCAVVSTRIKRESCE